MASGSSQFLTFESDNDPSGWVEIGYDSEKGLQIISQHELLAPPPPKITIRDGYVHITLASYSIFSVIEQSTDMKNWEAIAWDEYARVPLADNPGPLYFRERCP